MDLQKKIEVGQRWRRKFSSHFEEGAVYKFLVDSEGHVYGALIAVDGRSHTLTLAMDQRGRIDPSVASLWDLIEQGVAVIEPVLASPKVEAGQMWQRHYVNHDPIDHVVNRFVPVKGHMTAVLKSDDGHEEHMGLDENGFCLAECREYWSPSTAT